MNKLVLGLIIGVAFLAGTIATAIPVYAPPGGDEDNGLVDAVLLLAEILDNLEQIAGPQGEQGPPGADGQDGAPGEQGPPGPGSFPPIYTLFFNVQSTGFLQQFDCDPGDIALSGGLSVSSGGTIVASRAGDQTGGPPPGWRVTVTPAGITTLIDVICADVADPPHIP